MFNRYLSSSLLLMAGMATGCAQPATPSPYPSKPPVVSGEPIDTGPTATLPTGSGAMAPTATTVVKVPENARELSHGDYPPPAFASPSEPGLLLVVDMDGDPTVAVASTTITGKDGGKQMTITDITNMAGNMNKLHKFKIVFVPVGTGTRAAP